MQWDEHKETLRNNSEYLNNYNNNTCCKFIIDVRIAIGIIILLRNYTENYGEYEE